MIIKKKEDIDIAYIKLKEYINSLYASLERLIDNVNSTFLFNEIDDSWRRINNLETLLSYCDDLINQMYNIYLIRKNKQPDFDDHDTFIPRFNEKKQKIEEAKKEAEEIKEELKEEEEKAKEEERKTVKDIVSTATDPVDVPTNPIIIAQQPQEDPDDYGETEAEKELERQRQAAIEAEKQAKEAKKRQRERQAEARAQREVEDRINNVLNQLKGNLISQSEVMRGMEEEMKNSQAAMSEILSQVESADAAKTDALLKVAVGAAISAAASGIIIGLGGLGTVVGTSNGLTQAGTWGNFAEKFNVFKDLLQAGRAVGDTAGVYMTIGGTFTQGTAIVAASAATAALESAAVAGGSALVGMGASSLNKSNGILRKLQTGETRLVEENAGTSYIRGQKHTFRAGDQKIDVQNGKIVITDTTNPDNVSAYDKTSGKLVTKQKEKDEDGNEIDIFTTTNRNGKITDQSITYSDKANNRTIQTQTTLSAGQYVQTTTEYSGTAGRYGDMNNMRRKKTVVTTSSTKTTTEYADNGTTILHKENQQYDRTNGQITTTGTDYYSNGIPKSQSTTYSSATGREKTIKVDYDQNGQTSKITTIVKNADGSTTTTEWDRYGMTETKQNANGSGTSGRWTGTGRPPQINPSNTPQGQAAAAAEAEQATEHEKAVPTAHYEGSDYENQME